MAEAIGLASSLVARPDLLFKLANLFTKSLKASNPLKGLFVNFAMNLML